VPEPDDSVTLREDEEPLEDEAPGEHVEDDSEDEEPEQSEEEAGPSAPVRAASAG
jgi:segregation and condensation protein B